MFFDEDMDQAGVKRSVLIVEDIALNREMLSTLLEDDFNVIEAENGLEGLKKLEQNYQDLSLILLDVYMPECDGFEFLRRKRQDERYDSVPVIVTTASGTINDEIKCLELGANDFVVKPYNFEIMMNRIVNTVHLRESASIVNQLTWDNLTGLYSKEFFYRNVEDTFRAHPDRRYDMVCSDIDNFKSLNDRYGEKSCDQLLHDLAQTVLGVLPGLVDGGRIAGDTFAFLIEHQEPGWEDALPQAVESLPFKNLSVKFGIVEDVDRDLAVSAMCDRAIIAIEGMKGMIGVASARYDDALRQQQLTEQTLIESMEAALENREFSVWFQPKHDMHTDKTGGAEALARWIHPELGFVSPGLFIPLFERNGFITKLDMYIWEEACREIKRCSDLGLPTVPISINASRLDFDIDDLADKIAALADKYEIDRALLHVEVTETAYSDNPEKAISTLNDLRERGFLAELDDFGAGYSSLASLNTLPLDVMKLDMSLIRQATALGDFRIVEAALQLSKILGLKSVVEGVETVEEAEKLREMGCDLIQGYFYSKPLKQDEFEAYLAK